MRRKTLILTISLLIAVNIYAQNSDTNNLNFDINMDFASRYIWRGQKLSETPVMQPGMSASYKNFTLGTWASYSFGNEAVQEIDLYLNYTSDFFSFTLNDYFFPANSMTEYNDYFDWNKSSTQHWLEAIVQISGIENIPLSLLAGVFIAGADVDESLNSKYSTYIELDYSFNISKVNAELFAGITPYSGYYSDSFDFVNIGFKAGKEIQVTQKFSLPVSGALIVNPANKNIMFQALISL